MLNTTSRFNSCQHLRPKPEFIQLARMKGAEEGGEWSGVSKWREVEMRRREVEPLSIRCTSLRLLEDHGDSREKYVVRHVFIVRMYCRSTQVLVAQLETPPLFEVPLHATDFRPGYLRGGNAWI